MWAKYKHTPAFTIVELLIVIVVIGILAALVISTFSSAQARARDAKRATDIGAVEKALHAWAATTGNDFSALPTGCCSTPVPMGSGWLNAGYGGGQAVKTMLVNGNYLNSAVNDPLNRQVSGPNASAYMIAPCIAGDNKSRVLLANMESPQAQSVAQQLGGTTCNSTDFVDFTTNYHMDYARIVRVN